MIYLSLHHAETFFFLSLQIEKIEIFEGTPLINIFFSMYYK